MVFEILPVACMYSVLDDEIPFCATGIGFLCMFTINLRCHTATHGFGILDAVVPFFQNDHIWLLQKNLSIFSCQ